MGHGHGNTRLSDQHFTDCYNSLITMDWTGCASASTPANMSISTGVLVGVDCGDMASRHLVNNNY